MSSKWIDKTDETKWCAVCDCPVNFGDINQYITHIDGKQHRNKVKQQTGVGKCVPAPPNPKESQKDTVKKKEKNPDWYPPSLHHIIKTFDIHQLRKLKQIIESNPEVVLILDQPRFYNTLSDSLLALIYGLVIECDSNTRIEIADLVTTKFDAYYKHNEMKIYMCDLLCAICDFPFSIKRRLYTMPENYLKPIFIELFTKLFNKLDIESKNTCDRIVQISDYLKVTTSLDRGNVWDAQGVIEQNHLDRQQFAVDIYSEARRSWNHYSAQQKY